MKRNQVSLRDPSKASRGARKSVFGTVYEYWSTVS